MNKRLLFVAISIAIVLFLSHTRLGVFIVFDGVGDLFHKTDNVNTDSNQGPLVLDRSLTAEATFILPAEMEQASGIVASEGKFYISTDQAELFVLDAQFAPLLETDLLGGLLILKQGSVEAISMGDQQVMAIGELGVVGVWDVGNSFGNRLNDITLPAELAELEYTGLCKNSRGMWAVTDEFGVLYNLTSGKNHSFDVSGSTKAERHFEELMISGIDCDEDKFYLITENYTSIVILDKSHNLLEVVGIDKIEASDIAVSDDQIYVTVDHNYDDARPPVYKYRLNAK